MTNAIATKQNVMSVSIDELEPLVLLAFVTKWCPYCLLIPPVAKITSERTGCRVQMIDVEEEPDITAEFRVEAFPTVLLVRSGKVIGHWRAQTNPEDIPEFFANVCLINEIQVIKSS